MAVLAQKQGQAEQFRQEEDSAEAHSTEGEESFHNQDFWERNFHQQLRLGLIL